MSQPILQVEEILQANDQLNNGLRVYEILPKDDEEDSNEIDPAKMYATSAKKFDEPTSTVEEPMKEINLSIEDDLRNVIISLNLTLEEKGALINTLREYKDAFA